MNSHDSIKWFLNIQFLIIIVCLSIVSIVNIIYAIQSNVIYFRLFWNIFLVYFMIDLLIQVNDESELFIEKPYTFLRYKAIKIIRNI